MDAPARSETTTTTHDRANDGVPVGCLPPPNFWFIILVTTRAQQRLFLPTDFWNLPPHASSLNHRWLVALEKKEICFRKEWKSFHEKERVDFFKCFKPSSFNLNKILCLVREQGTKFYEMTILNLSSASVSWSFRECRSMAGEGEGPAIGIDLGTTYSCVAVWQNNRVEIIVNDQGNRTMPSYVAFTDKERLVGDAAKDHVAKNPANCLW
jgi:hypothetical protein